MSAFAFFPAILASLTALIVAVFAYKWQKELDRKQQQKSEKREAYRLFAQEVNSYFARCALGRKMPENALYNEHYLRVISAASALIMYAPKTVIESCQRYSMSVFEFSDFMGGQLNKVGYEKRNLDRKALYEKTKKLRKEAMIALRTDLEDDSLGDAKEAMDAFFVLTLDE